jgi:Zn/Cd-binding protein ZinT
MFRRSMLLMLALAATATVDAAQAQDKKYPDWKGEWNAVVPRTPGQQLRFDPTKPYGRRQEAPLTEEYQKIYQENL